MADRMAPPGMETAAPKPPAARMAPPGQMEQPTGAKAAPEEAMVIRADAHCIDCRNYDPTSGECSKVDGSFDPQDACAEFFDAIGSDEPDGDDMGGAADQDSDDSGMEGQA